MEQAVEAHLLEAAPDGTRVRFVHALTREALYDGILAPRRRIWHGQVAETLMAGARPDPDEVAYHLQQAGDPRAWEWLVKAGDRAQRAYAWVTAAERLQAAADLLELLEGEERTWCQLARRIGWLKRFPTRPGLLRPSTRPRVSPRGSATRSWSPSLAGSAESCSCMRIGFATGSRKWWRRGDSMR